MGKKLNGKLFRVNGKPFRVNGELIRVHGKLFHIDFSSCEECFLAIIGMFEWVLHRFQEANKKNENEGRHPNGNAFVFVQPCTPDENRTRI